MARRYTVADLASFPDDGKRYELIRGELVVSPVPAVKHQIVVGRLNWQLACYLQPLGLADTLFAVPADISWNEENLVQPDLLVLHPDDLSATWSTARRLRLAVEVISPSSRRRDRFDKRTLYQENHVEWYWVVDLKHQLVEVWRPADTEPWVERSRLTWQVEPAAAPVTIDLAVLFANLPG